ncbi:hypothetical protein J3459_018048 [Metarhizium acridum]|nr:hypothetical protein J3459_018048 [Metarhizium acridum]
MKEEKKRFNVVIMTGQLSLPLGKRRFANKHRCAYQAPSGTRFPLAGITALGNQQTTIVEYNVGFSLEIPILQHVSRGAVEREKGKLIHTSWTIPTSAVTTGSRDVYLLFPCNWVSKKQ